MTILAVINVLDNIEPEKGALMFGSPDLLPRFNLAIRLADYHCMSGRIVAELKAIRQELQNGVASRRNQAVHGAHSGGYTSGAVNLTMVRWSGARRKELVTYEDLIELTEKIYELQQQTLEVFNSIGEARGLSDEKPPERGGS